ncbi:MAG: hypothetical protein J5792_01970 [Bacteroidales bacterium]|nr:hypothetical protein [Bacteroidales bacterium]
MKKKTDIILWSGIGAAVIAYIIYLFIICKEWKNNGHEQSQHNMTIQYSNDSTTMEMTWEEAIKMFSEIQEE